MGVWQKHEDMGVRKMTEPVYRTLLKAIRVYGSDAQLKVLLEEMSELQKEICKNWRGKDNAEQIAEEIADVEIMLAQTKIIFGLESSVQKHRSLKIKRLALRLMSEKEEPAE